MKYIRTKDGIISSLKTVRTSDIVRKADTIEELCDELVLIRQEKELGETIRVFTRLELLLEFAICQWETDIIYGAIWTDKGLIYVAKMNEEGELCLI